MERTEFISGRETIFFDELNGALRQRVELSIKTFGDAPVNAGAAISAGNDEVVTPIALDPSSDGPYICWAPVVYPGAAAEADVKIIIDGTAAASGKMTIGTHRPWTIYVLTDDCADYTWGYTTEITERNSRTLLNSHLEWIERTSHLPSEIQNRYNINQSQEVDWFADAMPPAKTERLFKAIRDGHMQLSPAYNSSNTAMMLTEQLIRTLYYGRRLEKERGLDISVAQEMESPTCTWGLASMLASSGVKLLIRNWLEYYSPYCRDRDNCGVYEWQGPDGKTVTVLSPTDVCLKYAYKGARAFITETYDKAVAELHDWWIPTYEANPDYPFDALPMLGAYWDLHPSAAGEVGTLVNAIHRYHDEPWAYPKIINATWNQYYEHIQNWLSARGKKLPVLRGDYGSAWEEWPAGVAHILADMRNNINRYLAAEAFSSMALTKDGALRGRIDDQLRGMLKNMEQIAEHPWNGSADWEKELSNSRRAVHNREMAEYTDRMVSEASDILFTGGESTDGVSYVAVVNSLSWDVDRIVKIARGAGAAVYDDETGREASAYYDNGTLVFRADNIPASGYRIFRLHDRNAGVNAPVCCDDINYIENDMFKIVIDTDNGSIKSIYDKENRRELVDASAAYGVNQYAYLSENNVYTADDLIPEPDENKIYKAIVKPGWSRLIEVALNKDPKDEFLRMNAELDANSRISLSENTEHTLSGIRIRVEDMGGIGSAIIIRGTAFNSVVETRVSLINGVRRIDIENKVEKVPSVEPQEIHFMFPFSVPGGRFHYDGPGAVIRPEELGSGGDHLPGSGRQMYSVATFTDLSNDAFGVTLSNIDSTLMQFGRRTMREYPTDPGVPGDMMLSLVMTNKQPEMRQNQAGNKDFCFRYSILPHGGPYESDACYRFGAERNTEALCVPFLNKQSVPAKQFIELDRDDVVVSAFKPAELEPDRLFLRLRDVGGRGGEVTVRLHGMTIGETYETDLLERETNKIIPVDNRIKINIPAMGYAGIKWRI